MGEQSGGHSVIDLEQFDGWGYEQREAGIARYAALRSEELSTYRRLVEHLRVRSTMSEQDRVLYESAISHLSIDELSHPDLVAIARIQRRPIVHADSLFRSIVVRRRKKQLGPVPEKYLGIGKENDQLLADVLGVKTPTTFYTGTFHSIPHNLRTDVVLKPMTSSDSIGAFYIFNETSIFSIQHSTRLSNWQELSGAIVAEFGEGSLENLVFEIQELIYEDDGQPARDLKFYTFYGKIGLILEAVRYPFRQYAYFNEDLTRAICGRDHEPLFRDKSRTITDKGHITEENLEKVRWMSAQIPVPFMRIDFLNAQPEMAFVELSSAPGMSHSWNDAYDRLMGKHYNEAEIRLVNDLVGGKQFEGFQEFAHRLKSKRAGKALGSRG